MSQAKRKPEPELQHGIRIITKLGVTRKCGHEQVYDFPISLDEILALCGSICGACEDET
jgi:hypothetical protein